LKTDAAGAGGNPTEGGVPPGAGLPANGHDASADAKQLEADRKKAEKHQAKQKKRGEAEAEARKSGIKKLAKWKQAQAKKAGGEVPEKSERVSAPVDEKTLLKRDKFDWHEDFCETEKANEDLKKELLSLIPYLELARTHPNLESGNEDDIFGLEGLAANLRTTDFQGALLSSDEITEMHKLTHKYDKVEKEKIRKALEPRLDREPGPDNIHSLRMGNPLQQALEEVGRETKEEGGKKEGEKKEGEKKEGGKKEGGKEEVKPPASGDSSAAALEGKVDKAEKEPTPTAVKEEVAAPIPKSPAPEPAEGAKKGWKRKGKKEADPPSGDSSAAAPEGKADEKVDKAEKEDENDGKKDGEDGKGK
jgi:hypothetical protein